MSQESTSNDPRLAKLRADLGLPDKVQFSGYLVKVDDQNEFLGDISNGTYSFVASPNKRFHSSHLTTPTQKQGLNSAKSSSLFSSLAAN